MTNIEDIKKWREVSDFFFMLELQTEGDYHEGKISKNKRNKLISEIRKGRRLSLAANNPFLKEFPQLQKAANCLL